MRREKTPRERTPQRDISRHKNRTPPLATAPSAVAPKDKETTTVKNAPKEKEKEREKEKEDPAGVHSGSEEGEIEED